MLSVRSKPQVNNLSTQRLGVSCSWKTDKRRPGHPKYLRYQVRHIDDKGDVKVKGFYAGKEGESSNIVQKAALKAAIKFRKEYEKRVRNLQVKK